MSLNLPGGVVKDSATQQNLDGLAQRFPLQPQDIAGGTRNHGLVSALPTKPTPVKGDVCHYYADKTNGVVWQFIYDGEGELPWKYVGGPPLTAEVVTSESRTSSTYGDLATVGPSIELPLKGDYMVAIGAGAYDSGTVTTDAIMSYAIGGTAAGDADSIDVNTFSLPSNISATIPGGISRPRRKTGLTAVTLKAKYKSSSNSASAAATFYNRWMSAYPVRVG